MMMFDRGGRRLAWVDEDYMASGGGGGGWLEGSVTLVSCFGDHDGLVLVVVVVGAAAAAADASDGASHDVCCWWQING